MSPAPRTAVDCRSAVEIGAAGLAEALGRVRPAIGAGLLALAELLAMATLGGCGGRHAVAPAALPANVQVGAPVLSRYPPIVVPANARIVTSLSGPSLAGDGSYATYELPLGVSAAALRTWYGQQMPAESAFRGLRWLATLSSMGGQPDWYWCSAVPGRTLDVLVVQNEAKSGTAYVSVALQGAPAGTTACG